MLSGLFNSGSPVVIAPVPAEMQIHLQHLMEFMKFEYERGKDASELALRNCLATLFCVFLELLREQNNAPAPEKSGILYAISYVKKHYQEELSADGMAKLICMSKKEFVARFKTFSGRSFHDFLNKTRIEKATEILKKSEGNVTLSSLAQLCGYENYITFYRNFVKAMDGEEEQLITHDQLRRSMKIMEAAFRSDELGRPVEIDDAIC